MGESGCGQGGGAGSDDGMGILRDADGGEGGKSGFGSLGGKSGRGGIAVRGTVEVGRDLWRVEWG